MSYLLSDDFHRSDRPLHLDHAPTGQEYRRQGQAGTVDLLPVILNNEFVPDPATPRVAPYGTAILGLCGTERPRLVLARFTMGSGGTFKQNLVIGACETFLAEGSVQLAVWPRSVTMGSGGSPVTWHLFTVHRDTTNTVVYETIAKGLGADLALDVQHTVGVAFDYEESEITLLLPDGSVTTVPDARLAPLWGVRPFVQIRSAKPESDGYLSVQAFVASR